MAKFKPFFCFLANLCANFGGNIGTCSLISATDVSESSPRALMDEKSGLTLLSHQPMPAAVAVCNAYTSSFTDTERDEVVGFLHFS